MEDEAIARPFRYMHLGTLAYIGNAAVFDLGGVSFMGGLVAMYAWRSVYWNEMVSARTRALLMIDWIVRCVFVSAVFDMEKIIDVVLIVEAFGGGICPGSERMIPDWILDER